MARHEGEDFREMELWEHLAELRARLIRAVLYVFVSMAAAWFIYKGWPRGGIFGAEGGLYGLFMGPLTPVMKQHGWSVVYRHIMQGFSMQLQVSLIAGLVLALPLISLELWGFIAPGLTRRERKAFYVVVPMSLFFFFAGVSCGYFVMGPSVRWFAGFIPNDAQLLQDPLMYLIFMVKMVVAFGICFQMPVVLMFLAYVGMVSSAALVRQWRIALVACFAVGAIATPGGDPFSMVILALPLATLYVGSIFLCAFVERVRARTEKNEERTGAEHSSSLPTAAAE